jgi:hypothetical protein
MIKYMNNLRSSRDILKQVRIITSLIVIILLAASGCSQADKTPVETTTAVSETPAATAETVQSPTPSPASIPTTPPDITPQESVSPTATVSPEESGKETIADGFYYIKLNDQIKKRITGMSYPADGEDCKITYDDLRYIKLKYYDFEGNVHDDGELIVNAKLAKEVTKIFYELYEEKYQFASIKLVDDYGEPHDDNLSMAANNTSAFNYRKITGKTKLSQHSYGRAIDINPLMNPYIKKDGSISPANGAEYVDRSLGLPGMIDHDDLCYKLFKAKGWTWGGNSTEKDYQHFSKKAQ